MKKLILVLLITSGFIISHSQTTIYFDYDDSGNRTYRSLETPSQGKSTADKNSQQEFKDQIDGKEILIYPNPVTSELTIKLSSLEDNEFGSLTLYDQGGRLIYRNDKATVSNTINIADQLPGVYFLNICIGEKTIQWKIIKE